MLNKGRWLPFVTTVVALTGCADVIGTTAPGRAMPPIHVSKDGTVMTPSGEIPYFYDEGQVPSTYQARVFRVESRVEWSGSTAKAYGLADWFGNQGLMKFTMGILNKDGFVTGPTNEFPEQWVWPDEWIEGKPMEYTAAQSCGNTVNFNVHQDAAIIIGLKDLISWVWSRTSDARDSSDSQPPCPPPPETSGSGGSSGGSSGGGSVSPGGVCIYTYDYYIDTGEIIPGSYHIICTTDGSDGR